jgi:hypothetical protein
MITKYRKVFGGAGLDGYTTIELLQDGVWVHGATFSQDDDNMSTNMNNYISRVQRRIADEGPRVYRITNKRGFWNGIELLDEDFHLETKDREYAHSFVYTNSPYDVVSSAI